MSSIVALTDELCREEIARARAMRPEDKLLEGPRLSTAFIDRRRAASRASSSMNACVN